MASPFTTDPTAVICVVKIKDVTIPSAAQAMLVTAVQLLLSAPIKRAITMAARMPLHCVQHELPKILHERPGMPLFGQMIETPQLDAAIWKQ